MPTRQWTKFSSTDDFDFEHAVEHWNSAQIDPYLVWGFATEFVHYEDVSNEDIPVLIELHRTGEFNTAAKFSDACLEFEFIEIPKIYHDSKGMFDGIRHLTAMVDLNELLAAINDPENSVMQSIKRFQIGLSVKTKFDRKGDSLYTDGTTILAQLSSNDSSEVDRRKVYKPVVGVIDDGFGIFNTNFNDSTGRSRIRYFWNQNGDTSISQKITASSNPVSVDQFEYGYELNHTEIDAIRAKFGDVNLPAAESSAYKTMNYASVAGEASHGTHVLDCAAGTLDDTNAKIWNDTAIIAVQVYKENELSSDTSGRWLGVSMLDGIRYILDRVFRLPNFIDSVFQNVIDSGTFQIGQASQTVVYRPVLINISYGNIAGPHNGSSILETAIDELIEKQRNTLYPLDIFVSSGNHKQSKCHSCVHIKAGKSQELSWRVYPDDRTPSFMELWLPESMFDFDESSLELRVCAPNEHYDDAQVIKLGECWSLKNQNENSECVVVGLPKSKNAAGDRGMFLLATSSTFGNKNNAATPGVWKVFISNNSNASCEINAWIERDDGTLNAMIAGRQSHFEDSEHSDLDSLGFPLLKDVPLNGRIRVEGTVNGIATGRNTNVVASKTVDDERLTYYSGIGTEPVSSGLLSRQSSIRMPNLTMWADDSNVNPGTIASGTYSGSRITLSGTSVASALATREAVKWIIENKQGLPQDNPDLNPDRPERRGKSKQRS